MAEVGLIIICALVLFALVAMAEPILTRLGLVVWTSLLTASVTGLVFLAGRIGH